MILEQKTHLKTSLPLSFRVPEAAQFCDAPLFIFYLMNCDEMTLLVSSWKTNKMNVFMSRSAKISSDSLIHDFTVSHLQNLITDYEEETMFGFSFKSV